MCRRCRARCALGVAAREAGLWSTLPLQEEREGQEGCTSEPVLKIVGSRADIKYQLGSARGAIRAAQASTDLLEQLAN